MSSKNKYDPAIRDKLHQVEEEEWKDALARVLGYAQSRTRFISLLDCRIDSEELVHEAIARAYGVGTGKFGNITYRNWNQEKYPSLAAFLISVVKSLVDHILKEHKGLKFLPTIGSDNFQTEKVAELIQQQRPSETPETVVLNDERARDLNELLDEIASDDEEIGMYLLAVEADCLKAADQAAETGYDVAKIYNTRKRLRRKLNVFFDKIDK